MFNLNRIVCYAIATLAVALSATTVHAAKTDYDGVWDVYFACEYRYQKEPNFISYRDVIVKNGEGSLSVDTSNAKVSLNIALENNEVKLRRRGIGLADINLDWILKINGALFDNRSFNLAGISYRQASGAGFSQGASECHVGGFLREPAAASLAATQTQPAAKTAAPEISVYDGRWKIKSECFTPGAQTGPSDDFDLTIMDGIGKASWPKGTSSIEYQAVIENKMISLVRTSIKTADPSQQWQMKLREEMMSQTRLLVKGLIVPTFKGGAPSFCVATGYR